MKGSLRQGSLFSAILFFLFIDTSGAIVWRKKYTMMLDGVGSMVNNIMRAKMLRDGSLMVAGQAYEGNCWTRYQRLYFDAWWSPISYAYGTNETWDTAGTQGRSDVIYDFTQLIDGKLVFVGIKATPVDSGLWVFVTDSTGKQILWEKQYNLPGRDAGGYELKTLLPLSVCATKDSGFTVVGDNNTYGNNHNAFAMHFVPSEPITVTERSVLNQSNTAVKFKITGSKVVFTLPSSASLPVNLAVYNAAGKKIAAVENRNLNAGRNSLLWDYSGVGEGVYLYRLRFSDRVLYKKLLFE